MMHPSLKHIALFACAATMASSCSTDSPSDPSSGHGAEVTFEVADISRASSTSDITKFAVYGDMKHVAAENPSLTMVFNKTEVVKDGDGWSYDDTQYWFPNHEHSFIAIHPLSVLQTAQYADSKLSFTYTLPNSNDDVADIIAATHRRLYNNSAEVSPITFYFTHLLSQINFALEFTNPVTSSEESFKVHKFEMSGFGIEAAINIKPAPLQLTNQTGDSEIDITTTPGNGRHEISFTEPKEVGNDMQFATFIMLPQTFAANDFVKFTLTYSVNDETEITEVTATLSNFKWESGRSYNYKIKLELEQKDVNMVISEATIAPWNLIDDHDEVDAI